MIIFTTEFLLRFLLSASLRFGADLKLYFNIASEFPNEPALRSAVGNMVEFLILPPNVIDLLAILPFYVDLMWPDLNSNINSRVLRVLRLARVFRVLKMGKYSQGAQMVMSVCFRSANALAMMIIFLSFGSIIFGLPAGRTRGQQEVERASGGLRDDAAPSKLHLHFR